MSQHDEWGQREQDEDRRRVKAMTPPTARTIAEQIAARHTSYEDAVGRVELIEDIAKALTAARAEAEAELDLDVLIDKVARAGHAVLRLDYFEELQSALGATDVDDLPDIAQQLQTRLTAQEAEIARLREALQQIAHADAENCGCDHEEECCARVGVACAYCAATAALGASHG